MTSLADKFGQDLATKIQLDERRRRAVQLKVKGWPYRKIADELGVSHEQVRRDVGHVLAEEARARSEEAKELRGLADMRLERLHATTWNRATRKAEAEDVEQAKVRLKATEVNLKINESRRKLHGLDVTPGDMDPGALVQAMPVHERVEWLKRQSDAIHRALSALMPPAEYLALLEAGIAAWQEEVAGLRYALATPATVDEDAQKEGEAK